MKKIIEQIKKEIKWWKKNAEPSEMNTAQEILSPNELQIIVDDYEVSAAYIKELEALKEKPFVGCDTCDWNSNHKDPGGLVYMRNACMNSKSPLVRGRIALSISKNTSCIHHTKNK